MANFNLAYESGEDIPTCFTRVMQKLGGLKSVLKEKEPVVIAISMPFPEPAPVTTSFGLLKAVLQELKMVEVPRVQVCAVPEWGLNAEKVAQVLAISKFVRQFGAQFIQIDLASINNPENHSAKLSLPPPIADAPNYIALPSIRFDPVFGFVGASGINLQFLGNKYRIAGNPSECEKNFDGLHEKIMDFQLSTLNARVPDLTLVSGENLLAGQGPLLSTGGYAFSEHFILAGSNPLAIDKFLAEKLGFSLEELPLLKKSALNGSTPSDLLQKSPVNSSSPRKAESNLTSQLPPRIKVAPGKICLLCKRNLRILIDFLGHMSAKDLNNLEELNFLTGISPPMLDSTKNICIFGDCAKSSTKNYDFRHIKSKKITKKGVEKEIITRNKKIAEISGCPPLPFEALPILMKHFSKKNMPASLFWLRAWEGLRLDSKSPSSTKLNGSAG